jgi:hypothetical protein
MTAARRRIRHLSDMPLDLKLAFVVPRSPEGWRFRVPMNPECTLETETLAAADLLAMARDGRPPLTIYYGPAEGQKDTTP